MERKKNEFCTFLEKPYWGLEKRVNFMFKVMLYNVSPIIINK